MPEAMGQIWLAVAAPRLAVVVPMTACAGYRAAKRRAAIVPQALAGVVSQWPRV